jgi:uncharacterized protein (TIGR02145 family)
VVENGRARLVFGGVDASGHRSLGIGTKPASVQTSATRMAAAAGTDTLKLYWKGKRLVVMPIASLDSTGVVLRVDTAWSDDAGIPWNPAIAYGSVPDTRDGRTYRTVVIGSQRWMAENLAYPSVGSRCYDDKADRCAQLGRLYSWSQALALQDSCDTTICASQVKANHQGACPAGWHVPSNPEWTALVSFVDSDSRVGANHEGTALKATSSWDSWDTLVALDLFGFRALPAGAYVPPPNGSGGYFWLGSFGHWWGSTEHNATIGWYHYLFYCYRYMIDNRVYPKAEAYSLRCLKDTP